jgi:hypothetical protein
MLNLFLMLIAGFLRSRRDLLLENLALRQQLAAAAERCSRPRIAASDRIFWALLRRFWSGWREALVLSIEFLFRAPADSDAKMPNSGIPARS